MVTQNVRTSQTRRKEGRKEREEEKEVGSPIGILKN